LNKSAPLVGRWSAEADWPGRAESWDAEVDRRRHEEFMDAGADVAQAQAKDAAELRRALPAPARALRTRIDRLRADAASEPFQELSLAELLRLTVTAARAFAQVAQVERLAHGMSTENHGGPLVSGEVERMTLAELEEYLTGTAGRARRRASDTDAADAQIFGGKPIPGRRYRALG
jgi:hypothetical protein